jgi:hypothetical protein
VHLKPHEARSIGDCTALTEWEREYFAGTNSQCVSETGEPLSCEDDGGPVTVPLNWAQAFPPVQPSYSVPERLCVEILSVPETHGNSSKKTVIDPDVVPPEKLDTVNGSGVQQVDSPDKVGESVKNSVEPSCDSEYSAYNGESPLNHVTVPTQVRPNSCGITVTALVPVLPEDVSVELIFTGPPDATPVVEPLPKPKE